MLALKLCFDKIVTIQKQHTLSFYYAKLISLQKGAKANNAQTGKKGRASKNGKRNRRREKEEIRETERGGGDRGGQRKRSKSANIRGKDRRRNRICRARAVSGKRDNGRHRKTRNSKKTHNRGLCDSLTNTGGELPIRERVELRSSRRVQGRKVLTSKKSLMLAQFQVSKRK